MKDHLQFDTTDADTIAETDSVGAYIRSSDGTLITHTTDGSREAIDVYTELGQDEDAVHSSGDKGVMALAVRNDAGGPFAADGDYVPLSTDSTGALRVNATVNVDSNSDKDEDDAHTTGDIGEYILSVRMDDVDGANGALLAGTEGDYQSIFTNDKGELHTRDNDVFDVLDDLRKLEDAVHGSGDSGLMSLAVRNDAQTPLAADGDYIPLTTDDTGALYVANTFDAALANTSIANDVNTLAVASTAEDVVASPLSNRKYLFIYNADNRRIFVGASGVTTANGFPVSPGSYLELRAGASIDIEWVSAKVSHEIRTLELS